MIKVIWVGLLVAGVSGCASTYKGEFKATGEPVTFERHTGLCLDSLVLTLPDGETYIGYVSMSPGSSADAGCDSGNLPGMSPDATVMFSDRAGMMQCELQEQRTCRLSDGRSIVVENAGAP